MLTKEYREQEALDCLRAIAREMSLIRRLLEADAVLTKEEVIITKDDIIARGKDMIPDLESFFEGR